MLHAQVRIMAEQLVELTRMVNATYRLQLDLQRTLHHQVGSLFNQAAAMNTQTSSVHVTVSDSPVVAAAAQPMMASATANTISDLSQSNHSETTVMTQEHQMDIGSEGALLMDGAVLSVVDADLIGDCVICGDKVDSVIYRCGHMCVCNLCARTLQSQDQWCPVCRGPIEDIVRVYIS